MSTSKANSYCIDGDIKLVAGEATAAAESYLRAHGVDPAATREHTSGLSDQQRDAILEILEQWTIHDAKLKPRTEATDRAWEFIFCLNPEAVFSCISGIDDLFKEDRYSEIIERCSAILKHQSKDDVSVLLQRGLARALLGGVDKDAVSDYLRAFLKDRGVTVQVMQEKQSAVIGRVKQLMRDCVYSKPPNQSETKAFKQWTALTLDCCRFLLTFEPHDFVLQMTFVDRLQVMHKNERAVVVLSEILDHLKETEQTDQVKVTEVLLRRASCHIAKQNHESAIADLSRGLTTGADWLKQTSGDDNDELEHLIRHGEKAVKIAKVIFGEKWCDLYGMLERAASKLSAEERFKSVIKMENLRLGLVYYRAMIVLQPDDNHARHKLAYCYARMGKSEAAVKILNRLLEGGSNDSSLLSARATCYRELGNKDDAKKDYDALLRNNPRDVILLCERAIVSMDDGDVKSAVDDLLVACNVSQKQVVSHLNKEVLVHRTRTRQLLFDFAKTKLQESRVDAGTGKGKEASSGDVISDEDPTMVALSISQLLTKLNPADQSCHILMAHAMFLAGCSNDAETKLKKMSQEMTQGIDLHVIKLHLGIMKIFTKRRDEGMTEMIDVLTSKGDRIFSSLLRDIPISERGKLSDESHQYGISLLQGRRDPRTVRQAVHCFTMAILLCRGTDLVLEGLNGGTGVYRSYLARAECMAHLSEQRAAILDFSAAIEVNPQCVDGLCGRSFMRLALGKENECVNDLTSACDIDLHNVVAHIHALPDEARKLLLFWIDHRVVVLLLNYGYRSNDRLNTGGSASTISMLDETIFKPGEDVSPTSSLSTIHPPTPPHDVNKSESIRTSDSGEVTEKETQKKLHKSEATTQDINESIMNLDPGSDVEASDQKQQSRGSTSTSVPLFEDPLEKLERSEILQRALLLGRLLISVDGSNSSWHGMYADILIVKGDYDEALRHLQAVMELTPSDVTATARAGLINVKMNQYNKACRLLSGLANVDNSGLKYVLKALDAARRKRLAEESFNFAEACNRDSKYFAARDYYSLSLLADPQLKLEKLRMRSRCHSKLGDTSKAIGDISDVIKEMARKPQSHDYCVRASFYLQEGKESQACMDYMKAIEIDRNQAISQIHVRPGRSPLCDVFYRQAMTSFSRHNYQECSDMCDVALLIDDGNIDIRKLRARAKREISKCVIQ